MTTFGSLFSGYGGLDMGIQSVLGGTTSWVSENEAAPSKILAHHWPTIPNLGDVTKVDWAQVPRVDVLTGGFPCQDVSHAGKRLGLRPGTRTGLWAHMAYAVDQLRPRLVVIENVRGLLSATAVGDVEPCPWCVGDGEGSPMRALGCVLADLAGLGYDARWYGLRAADVGAPHGRFRIFVFAQDTQGDGWGSPWDQNHQIGATDATQSERRGAQPEHLGAPPGSAAEPRERAGASTDWGQYAPAINQWERVLGRHAPAPTEPGPKGGQRLSPAFVEWLMGLPEGHVTGVRISRNDQLKALGNGVVPQQAAAATRLWLAHLASVRVA